MAKREYEVIHALNLSGEKSSPGEVVEVEEEDAARLTRSGVLRLVPQKQSKSKSDKSQSKG